ncbi:sensor histidine kinase [Cohnella suwonensis]|uniref:Sensor histidine kinase n=1 Tax=Cohnella suwonensis TaxID=696072 RepID=A0ABW0LX70_9BACL
MNDKLVLLSRLRYPSFRTKLVLSYIILITIPLSIMGYKYYHSSKNAVSDFARQNIYSIVKQNNQIVDGELGKVADRSLGMIADQELYAEYKNVQKDDGYSVINMEKKISKIITRYFSEYNNIYSIHLMTSYNNIGTASLIPYQNFYETKLYREAERLDGGLGWIPTYDFTSMFNLDYLQKENIDYNHLFSAVRKLKLFKMNNSELTSLDGTAELPTLVVNYDPSFYATVFESSMPNDGSYFFVTSKEGDIIAHSDKSKIATRETPPWLAHIADQASGSEFIDIDGKKMIVCYDTSRVTGWISAIVVSPEALMSSFTPEIQSYTVYIALILVTISLLFAFLISGSITKPIHKLLQAIKKMGQGDFDSRIPGSDRSEMGYLIRKFNQMNDKINLLIEENYKVTIREKEAEIMALNVQMNPHFLYNSLNIINWMAIENNQKDISKMLVSLSSMLQYTSQNLQELTSFSSDLEWLQHYIFIIQNRFEGKFDVQYDIDPELAREKVPKLFLQPFVENAILHGFALMDEGGWIRISGRIEGKDCIYTVEDNGIGFDPDTTVLTTVGADERESIGIQNVDKRIKLIYGGQYGVAIRSSKGEGTIVKIVLPKTNK